MSSVFQWAQFCFSHITNMCKFNKDVFVRAVFLLMVKIVYRQIGILIVNYNDYTP